MLERLIIVSDDTKSELDAKGISYEDIVQVLNDGEVYYSKSDKRGDNKAYVIEKDGQMYTFTLPYESFVSEVTLSDDGMNASTTTSGMADVIHFPNDSTLVYPDSSSIVTCQQDKLGLINPKDILELMKAGTKIDLDRSNLAARPKAEHYLIFEKDGEELGVQAIWYKNKLNITLFETKEGLGCETN